MPQEQDQAYIRQNVLKNLEESKRAREANNEGKGLDYSEHKFNSHNFDKLEKQRGSTAEQAKGAKESFNRWSPDRNESMSKEVTAKHSRPEGESAYMYGTKGGRTPSGRYVTETKYDHVNDAKRELATPTQNRMNERREVKVYGDQVRGTVAPQKGWTDKAQSGRGDHVERAGGGQQIYTKGIDKNAPGQGAVRSQRGTKTDMKPGNAPSKTDEFGIDISKADKPKSTSQDKSRGH